MTKVPAKNGLSFELTPSSDPAFTKVDTILVRL